MDAFGGDMKTARERVEETLLLWKRNQDLNDEYFNPDLYIINAMKYAGLYAEALLVALDMIEKLNGKVERNDSAIIAGKAKLKIDSIMEGDA